MGGNRIEGSIRKASRGLAPMPADQDRQTGTDITVGRKIEINLEGERDVWTDRSAGGQGTAS
jgi:hypothetical protein